MKNDSIINEILKCHEEIQKLLDGISSSTSVAEKETLAVDARQAIGRAKSWTRDLPRGLQSSFSAFQAKAEASVPPFHDDCLSCGGKCCGPTNGNTILLGPLSAADARRMDKKHPGSIIRTTTQLRKEKKAYIATRDKSAVCTVLNPCSFLTGTPGIDALCSIYDHRPELCRDFPPGCSSCLRFRQSAEDIKKGVPSLVSEFGGRL
jgi:Fe-S-cluster containining protein